MPRRLRRGGGGRGGGGGAGAARLAAVAARVLAGPAVAAGGRRWRRARAGGGGAGRRRRPAAGGQRAQRPERRDVDVPGNYPAPYTVPRGIIMWGGGGGQGPRMAPGIYTVKLSMGTWSQTQTFHLGADPRYQPAMTDADGAAQLKMALEVGGWVKTLYDNLAKIRDAKKQAADIAQKTPAVAAGRQDADRQAASRSKAT